MFIAPHIDRTKAIRESFSDHEQSLTTEDYVVTGTPVSRKNKAVKPWAHISSVLLEDSLLDSDYRLMKKTTDYTIHTNTDPTL